MQALDKLHKAENTRDRSRDGFNGQKQQTLEIQELLKLHEESEDILKKKMTLIQILEQ